MLSETKLNVLNKSPAIFPEMNPSGQADTLRDWQEFLLALHSHLQKLFLNKIR
jgi:hypothetical protein